MFPKKDVFKKRCPNFLLLVGTGCCCLSCITKISSSFVKNLIVGIQRHKQCSQITHPPVFNCFEVLLLLTLVQQDHLQSSNGCLHVPSGALTKVPGQTTCSPVAISYIILMLGPSIFHIFCWAYIICWVAAGAKNVMNFFW